MRSRTPAAVEPPTLTERVRKASQARRATARSSARQAILESAAELLLAAGYEAFSLRKVAERVGYTATTIYRHFANRDALLYAVTEEGFRLFTERLRAAGAALADPFDALEAMALAYIHFGLEQPVYYRMLFMSRPDLLWRRTPDRSGSRMDRLGMFRSAVQAAVASGRTAERDVLAISNALWAQTHGAVSLALSMPHLPSPQARAFGELGVVAFVRGIRRDTDLVVNAVPQRRPAPAASHQV